MVYIPKASINIYNIMWYSQFECILRGILNYRKYVSKDLVYVFKFSIDIYNIMWYSYFEYILRGNIEL